MPNPVSWTEDDVLALPAGENDSFERKGSRLLDLTLPGVKEGDVLNELAKQLSAFSNAAGGQIIYGVADNGAVDGGGVAPSVKGSTKEWLEDVIPKLTEFEIIGFNVYEIAPKPTKSAIGVGKAIFVMDIPPVIALRISPNVI
jgi:predicted HTH transcriptional regulator